MGKDGSVDLQQVVSNAVYTCIIARCLGDFQEKRSLRYLSILFAAVLLPYDGPGIPDDHPDMIICVIVRHRDAAAAAARLPASSQRSKHNESRAREPQKTTEVKSIVEIPLERKNRR